MGTRFNTHTKQSSEKCLRRKMHTYLYIKYVYNDTVSYENISNENISLNMEGKGPRMKFGMLYAPTSLVFCFDWILFNQYSG